MCGWVGGWWWRGGGVGGGEISKRNLAVVVWRLNFPGETRGQRSVQELGPEASPRAADGQIGSDWIPSPLVMVYLRPLARCRVCSPRVGFGFRTPTYRLRDVVSRQNMTFCGVLSVLPLLGGRVVQAEYCSKPFLRAQSRPVGRVAQAENSPGDVLPRPKMPPLHGGRVVQAAYGTIFS